MKNDKPTISKQPPNKNSNHMKYPTTGSRKCPYCGQAARYIGPVDTVGAGRYQYQWECPDHDIFIVS